jgi:hypothetical protein
MFKNRSGVAGHRPPTADKVPPWFACGCLRPADARVPNAGTGREQDGAREMRCGHGARDLRSDTSPYRIDRVRSLPCIQSDLYLALIDESDRPYQPK